MSNTPEKSESTARPHASVVTDQRLDNSPAMLYSSVLTEKRVVSLIFEGYTDDDTMRSLISVVKSKNIPCVFFISGSEADEHPDVVKGIANANLTIGNYGINAEKKMEDNGVQENIHQFQLGQELLFENAGVKPTLFRCNGTEYTKEVLQAASSVGLLAGVNPSVYLNHRSFDEKANAVLFAQRLTRGSIISIKLGQELDATEYDGAEVSMEKLAVDPPPFLSDDMEETIRMTYGNIVNVVSWLLEALNSEGYDILSPEALQSERLSAFDSPIELNKELLATLDPSTYALPVTEAPLGIPENEATNGTSLNGAVFVGDSIMVGLQNYVAWRRETDRVYLGTAQFLTAANLGVVASQRRVTPDSNHPVVDGKKMAIEAALKKLGAKIVYLMPGLSDVNNNTEEKLIENLKLLIYQIERENPDIHVYMMSIPPGVAGRYAEPTNAKIFRYNLTVFQFCLQYGIPFVDTAYALRDKSGDLPVDLCIDPDTYGVHMNDTGCERWIGYVLNHMPS